MGSSLCSRDGLHSQTATRAGAASSTAGESGATAPGWTLEREPGARRAAHGHDRVLVVMAAIFVWGALSARLERADLTAPIVFVALGGLLGRARARRRALGPGTLTPLVEVTLVWVLFSDAARVPFRSSVATSRRTPGCSASGCRSPCWPAGALAAWLLPGLGAWLALLVGAALAPTDAALGRARGDQPGGAGRTRRLITVESGLNDGIATPVVMLALAGAASAEGVAARAGSRARRSVELAIGVVVGGRVGVAGGWLLRGRVAGGGPRRSSPASRCWPWPWSPTRVPSIAHGNGFVAAFCGGLAFGAAAGRRGPAELVFVEQAAEPGLAARLARVRGDRDPDHAGPR